MPSVSTSRALTRPPVSTARVALLVAVAHGFTDLYQSFVSPLLPRLMDRLGLSIGMAAGAAMVLSCNLVAVALRSFAEVAFLEAYGAAKLPWLLIANATGWKMSETIQS